MNILFICHRVPYPPNKGEKIRPFHIIKHLSQRHKIYLYSLCDNKADLHHQARLEEYCCRVNMYRTLPFFSALRAFVYLFTSYPLTFGYFFSGRMKRDIKKILDKENIDVIFASCSSSAQYALDIGTKARIADFIDIDSYKWLDFAKISKFPLSLIYRLESRRLREWERRINKTCDISIVTTEKEKERLGEACPLEKGKIRVVNNGVDFEYFKPPDKVPTTHALVFTGQMDYLPNVDAVKYFYSRILPLVKKQVPDLLFYIAGRRPSPVIKLCCKGTIVTGEVGDIRDYLKKASVYVAPIRIAHGVQNKILEAMASGLPVVATSRVLRGIKAVPDKDVLVGDTPEEFAQKIIELLKNERKREFISKNALEFVKNNHDWRKNLSGLDYIIKAAIERPAR